VTAPPLIAAAFLAALAIPCLLIGLAFGPASFREPWSRYKASVAIACAGWIATGLILAARGFSVPFFDWVASFALILASALAAFVIWSVLAWGFTLNMLLHIANANRPVDTLTWVKLYSGHRSFRQIAVDRLHILFASGLARRHGENVELAAGMGRVAVTLLVITRRFFGMS
jgi:hypothetical protein